MSLSRRAIVAGLSSLPVVAHAGAGARVVHVDLRKAGAPVDRFFDLSIGSDYPGTLIRDDSQAQLKTTVDELGFRYIRFHAVFHDVLGTVKVQDGSIVYDWTRLDQLYDALLSKGIKPFVELGFTPEAMKTSDLTIFYWKGNTSHPKLGPVARPDRRLRPACAPALWRGRSADLVLRGLERAQPGRLLGEGRPSRLFRAL